MFFLRNVLKNQENGKWKILSIQFFSLYIYLIGYHFQWDQNKKIKAEKNHKDSS